MSQKIDASTERLRLLQRREHELLKQKTEAYNTLRNLILQLADCRRSIQEVEDARGIDPTLIPISGHKNWTHGEREYRCHKCGRRTRWINPKRLAACHPHCSPYIVGGMPIDVEILKTLLDEDDA